MDLTPMMDGTTRFAAKKLQELAYRQSIHAYNIANASTPHFKPIRFQDELEQAEKTYKEPDEKFNLEDEMHMMNENRLEYSTYVKILTTKFGIYRKVASNGKQ